MEILGYRNDLIDGPYIWNSPAGKPGLRGSYRMGQLTGPLTVLDEKGQVIRSIKYPRSLDAVQKMFSTNYPAEKTEVKFTTEPKVTPPYKGGVLAPETLDAAIKYARLYRYLSGVPWENLRADPGLCEKCAAGTVLLTKIGSLTHTPQRPADMDAAFFALAYAGCHESNLNNSGNPVESVRSFIDDSDDTNVDRVGHRQWMLCPGLLRVGFGSATSFCAMHVIEGDRPVNFDYNYIPFPGEGYFPRHLIEPHFAWSIHFNGAKVKLAPRESIKITLRQLDEHYQAIGEATPANVIATPDPIGGGFNWRTIVFRPQLTEITPGRYWVEVSGVKSLSGAEAPFGYIVEFIDMPAAPSPAGSQ